MPVLLVGIDWADGRALHCVMDKIGATLASGSIPHTPEGLATLFAAIGTHARRPEEVAMALETSHGLLVSALLDQGFVVYGINPKVDHRTVADRLGHSSPSFTMKTYVHGIPESQRRAAEVANTLLIPLRGSGG